MAKKWVLAGVIALVAGGCDPMPPPSHPTQASQDPDKFMAGQVAKERKDLSEATTDGEKVFPMAEIAKYDVDQGNLTEAGKYATQLLAIAPTLPFPYESAHGIAIHDGNMVLGRIALKEGRREDAKAYLLKAGRTNGAPTLDTFGPNMSLAQDLLEVGEKKTVLQYSEECRKFWEPKLSRIDTWEKQIKRGQTPDFGANLTY